jgi:hypothetical protein
MNRKLEEVLGSEEAGTLMDHIPPVGLADLSTKKDLENLEHRLTAKVEESARRLVMWTSSMVVALAALAFAAGRFV